MVTLYVGITDDDWFHFLASRPDLDEVNFWQPGGQTNFRALSPGELFLFKLHSPLNFIVGGGVFARAELLPASLAWESFGPSNGASSLEEMRRRIAAYRHEPFDARRDFVIGCRILTQPFFLAEKDWIPVPASWSRHIQQGRTYDAASGDGLHLWDTVVERQIHQPAPKLDVPRHGRPVLIHPRLGQGAFRIGVTSAYQRRCAITGEKTLPILDAAHIRPYAEGGEHDVSNGFLFRTDIHRLFDLGYVTVTNDYRFQVGKRLREDFENGKHYYEMNGHPIALPAQRSDYPNREAIEWHKAHRFLG